MEASEEGQELASATSTEGQRHCHLPGNVSQNSDARTGARGFL